MRFHPGSLKSRWTRPQSSAVQPQNSDAVFPKEQIPFLLLAVFLLGLLFITSFYNFLLFHVLVEIFSVIVAFAIFMFAWNTRTNFKNSTFMLLGVAYLVIGTLDLLHTLSYKGMGVFADPGANHATQLWIAARYVESLSIAGALLLSKRRIAMPALLICYGAILCAVILTIFIWPVFPVCYIDGVGLTPFKKASEYAISCILLASLVLLVKRKNQFDRKVVYLLGGSIIFTVIAELMFTFYISVYGISNLIGHFFKLGSFWMIYTAIIETGLQEPFKLLFRDLKESESRLSKSRKRYKDLVDRLPTGICEIDENKRITFLNPAGMELFGYDAGDIEKGLYLDRLLVEKELSKAESRMALLREDLPMESAEYQVARKDGATLDVIVNSSATINSDGIQVVQASMTDVTNLNRLQRRLQQASKMEAVATLAGGMAHEVNNALASVVGNVELLRLKVRSRPVGDADFSVLESGCERISKLINQLLAYSRSGRYRSKSIHAADFVAVVLKAISHQTGSRIQFGWTADPDLPDIIADPLQLQMVLDGLLNNAVEAITDTGRIDVEITSWEAAVDSETAKPGMQPGRYVLIRIRDNGKGMDEETLERIFEPFYSKKFAGRGLGMAAAYGIVKNHGGWIGLESTPGVGTTASIYFPAA